MSFAVASVAQKPLTQAPELSKPTRWDVIKYVALKTLSMAAIVVGSAGAITGAVVVTWAALNTGFLAPLVLPCFTGAYYCMYATGLLVQNHVTALGAMFPAIGAGVCLSPFLVPIAIGALPGASLIGLGAWSWSTLS